MRSRHRALAAIGLVIVLGACGARVATEEASPSAAGEDAGPSATSDGGAPAPDCPFPLPPDTPWPADAGGTGGLVYETAACPAGCSTVDALQRDVDAGCARVVALGCLWCGGEGCGGGAMSLCFRNVQDGRIVYTHMWAVPRSPEWEHCSSEDFAYFTTDRRSLRRCD